MGKVTVLIPCAGKGKRMGGTVSKPYLEVLGRPLLTYTLDRFQNHPLVDEIILIVNKDSMAYCRREILERYAYTKVKKVAIGGWERQDSVANGLSILGGSTNWVIVHDAVRPLVTADVITSVLNVAFEKGNAIVGVPVKDTIKKVGPDMIVKETPDRKNLWQIQTPQVFRRDILEKAYQEAASLSWRGTDDASLVERIGVPVNIVRGEYTNIKVTTPEDLAVITSYIRMENNAHRVRV